MDHLAEPESLRLKGPERACYTEARLKELAKITETLRGARWHVWFTEEGLGVEPPVDLEPEWGDVEGLAYHGLEDKYYEYLDLLGGVLAELGIHEPLDRMTSRWVERSPD